jgi:hypothetical protein
MKVWRNLSTGLQYCRSETTSFGVGLSKLLRATKSKNRNIKSIPHLIGHNGDRQAAQLIGYNHFLTLLATMADGQAAQLIGYNHFLTLLATMADGQAAQLIGYNHFLTLLATMAMGRLPS